VEIDGWLKGLKVVRGVLNIVIETLEPSGKTKRRRYKVRPDKVSMEDLNAFLNTAVRLTLVGGLVEDIFPQ
jgi:hypothetical protein